VLGARRGVARPRSRYAGNRGRWQPGLEPDNDGDAGGLHLLPARARPAGPAADAQWLGLVRYIILFELRRDGPRNDRWQYCNAGQRAAVAALLEHLYETRKQEIGVYDCEYELQEALEIWLDRGD